MKKSLKSPRGLAFMGLMLAVTIIMDLTPLGAIPLGPISATVIHIPTIITGVVLGPISGLIMGTSLGIISLIHAATRPMTLLDPLFINPLVSILPRMFIGVVAYYVYILFKKLISKETAKNSISTFLAGVLGSMTNTFLVFSMLYLVYAKEAVEILGATFKTIIIAVFTTNAIAEAIISGFVVMAISLAYFRYEKSRRI